MIYANAALRADASVLARNRRGQSGLWGYAHLRRPADRAAAASATRRNIELVRQLVQAHAYWRLKGLAVDLVIWNEDHSGYRQALQDQIMGLIAASAEAHVIDQPGGIFVRRGEQMSEEDRVLLQTVARVVLTDSRGTLAEQVERRGRAEAAHAAARAGRAPPAEPPRRRAAPRAT